MRYPGLDFLRVLSIFLVMFSHLGYRAVSGIGVPLLMVLSGFLVTTMVLREWDRTESFDVGGFYLRRLFRIGPAYIVCIAVSFSLDFFMGDYWDSFLIFSAATYTVNYFNAANGHVSSISHLWTLAVLEQFYLISPLFLIPALKNRSRAYLILIFLILAGLFWRSFLYLGMGVDEKLVYNGIESRLDMLAWGCLMAFFLVDYPMDAWPKWVLKAVVLMTPFCIPFIVISYRAVNFHYSVGYLFEAVLSSVLILGVIKISSTRLFGFIRSGVFFRLAMISYPCYLYHIWGISIARRITESEPLVILFSFLTTVALGTLSYIFIERPALRWRMLILNRRRLQAT